jgi:hypothetical protein
MLTRLDDDVANYVDDDVAAYVDHDMDVRFINWANLIIFSPRV